jgi:hypothetical protein
MKTVKLGSKGVTLRRLLAQAQDGDVVFMTEGGSIKYVLATADDADREIYALRSNPAFMAHLAEMEVRARSGPRKTLGQVRERFDPAR